MLSFTTFLNETFDSLYPVSRKNTSVIGWLNEIVYEFRTDKDQLVKVKYNKLEKETIWGMEFKVNGIQNITGEGDALKIFSTVISTLKDFVKTESPAVILFTAEKDPKTDSNSSRASLYTRLVKNISKEIGYSYTITPSDQKTTFELTKK